MLGIDQGHIFGVFSNMLDQGCDLAAYWTGGPDVTETKFNQVFPYLQKAIDYRQILDDPTIQIVLISAVPADRAELALEARRAGKDDMVDKLGCTTLVYSLLLRVADDHQSL